MDGYINGRMRRTFERNFNYNRQVHWSQAVWTLALVLDYVSDVERGWGGTCCMGNSLSSVSPLLRPAPWRGLASAAAMRRHNTKDMKALVRDVDGREDFPQDRSHWREELNRNQRRGEEKLQLVSDELRVRRKNRLQAPPAGSTFKCSHCGRQGL